jgi:rhodanese-related sulfurtransferase
MTIREISIDDLAAARDAGPTTLIDVRNADEYAAGHIPGARLIPLPELADHIADLLDAGEVQLVCQSGNRSARAAEYLTGQGIDAVSVTGGTKAWIAAGRTVHPD